MCVRLLNWNLLHLDILSNIMTPAIGAVGAGALAAYSRGLNALFSRRANPRGR